MKRFRTPAAIMLAPAIGSWAGYGLSISGFGFFPAWLILSLICPAIPAVIAESHRIPIAVSANVAMMGFLLASEVKLSDDPVSYTIHPHYVVFAGLSLGSVGIAFLVALLLSIRGHADRSADSRRGLL